MYGILFGRYRISLSTTFKTSLSLVSTVSLTIESVDASYVDSQASLLFGTESGDGSRTREVTQHSFSLSLSRVSIEEFDDLETGTEEDMGMVVVDGVSMYNEKKVEEVTSSRPIVPLSVSSENVCVVDVYDESKTRVSFSHSSLTCLSSTFSVNEEVEEDDDSETCAKEVPSVVIVYTVDRVEDVTSFRLIVPLCVSSENVCVVGVYEGSKTLESHVLCVDSDWRDNVDFDNCILLGTLSTVSCDCDRVSILLKLLC
jgi:hypothetical protein